MRIWDHNYQTTTQIQVLKTVGYLAVRIKVTQTSGQEYIKKLDNIEIALMENETVRMKATKPTTVKISDF